MKKSVLFILFGVIVFAVTLATGGTPRNVFGPPVYVTLFPEKGFAYTLASDPRKGFPDVLVLNPLGDGAKSVLLRGFGKGGDFHDEGARRTPIAAPAAPRNHGGADHGAGAP